MSVPAQLTLDQAFQLARQSFAAGDLIAAERLCRQILELVPNEPIVLRLLALIAIKSNRADIAIQCLLRCTSIEPSDADLRLELGNALLTAGRAEEAVAAYRYAVELDPKNVSAHTNLGIALHEARQSDQAIEYFQKAVSLNPASPEAQNNLGQALAHQGRFEASYAALREAIQLLPNWIEPRLNFGNALKNAGLLSEAIDAYGQAISLAPDSPKLHSARLLAQLYAPSTTAAEIHDAHRRWNDRFAKSITPAAVHQNDRSPMKRLRIGYVSPNLRQDDIANFFEYLLACHDAEGFEIFCYADLLRVADPVSERLKSSSHQWRKITGMSDRQVYEMIRADQIDILVDLIGHHPGNRLLVFAGNPAPVQFSYLGYPVTTGLDAIQYRMTDPFADPEGSADAYYAEKLLRLPKSFLCYRPPQEQVHVAPAPVSKNGFVTFCSFNRLTKINQPLADLWSQILRQSPGARLLLKSHGLADAAARNNLSMMLSAAGISMDQVDLLDYVDSHRAHLELYHRADIGLDTFPYNGLATTCEALWMGVPVISLAGSLCVGRMGASILSNVGVPELVANSSEEYVSIAVSLAADRNKLSSLRGSLRDRMKQSPLMAGISFARDVERLYRAAWVQWCQSPAVENTTQPNS